MNINRDHLELMEEFKKARETFIKERTIEEQKFNKWYSSLMQCSEELVLSKIPFDYRDMSIKTLIPEWYEDIPDINIAEEQVKKANEKLTIINNIMDNLNKEGLAIIKEFNRLSSGGV